jgi:hypothetical protein
LICPVLGNFLTGFCISSPCPKTPIFLFADMTLKQCKTKCPPLYYGNRLTQICVSPNSCQNNFFADDSTNMCVSVCPSSQNTFGDSNTKRCVPSKS